jgi:excisionase family DNA binding protein
MDQLMDILPFLSGQQIHALTQCATAMLSAKPAVVNERMTVPQLSKRYGISQRTIYAAVKDGRLDGVTPNGQSRPIYVSVDDFERWMGW